MRPWWLAAAFAVAIWPPLAIALAVLLVVNVADWLSLQVQLLADRAQPLPKSSTRS